ncbi:MAG: hypothetical protein AVDCRST_MAG41-104, partial [uncultured Corynebacteriales bacterium]
DRQRQGRGRARAGVRGLQAVRPALPDRRPDGPVRRRADRRRPVRLAGGDRQGRRHPDQPLDGSGDAGRGAALPAVGPDPPAAGGPAGRRGRPGRGQDRRRGPAAL